MKTSTPTLTALFTSSAICLLALQNTACTDLPPSDQADPLADSDKSATYFEEWLMAGYDDAGRLEGYCAWVGDAAPRITAMYVPENDGAPTKPPITIEIVGCAGGTFSFDATIFGALEPYENGFFVLGEAYADTYSGDSMVRAIDEDSIFTFSYTESNKHCQPQGDVYFETATREVTLQAPTSDYQTAALLAQVLPSTLDGIRAVDGCY